MKRLYKNLDLVPLRWWDANSIINAGVSVENLRVLDATMEDAARKFIRAESVPELQEVLRIVHSQNQKVLEIERLLRKTGVVDDEDVCAERAVRIFLEVIDQYAYCGENLPRVARSLHKELYFFAVSPLNALENEIEHEIYLMTRDNRRAELPDDSGEKPRAELPDDSGESRPADRVTVHLGGGPERFRGLW